MLSNRFHGYISRKGDIGMSQDIKRDRLIQNIIQIYKVKWGNDNYEGWLQNDTLILIGYSIDLERNNDQEGLELWNDMNEILGGKETSLSKITFILDKLPTYALLSLVGYHAESLEMSIKESINNN